jgi:CheY-like chemotaxis protein
MSRSPRILLVDDDESYLLVAERALRREGVEAEIEVARDGGEVLHRLGLDLAPGTGAPPDGLAVILLDLNMPVLDGWEVLRRVRSASRTRAIPIVVISTSGRPDEVRRSYDLGANSFVVKRFDAGRPGGYVVDAVRYWTELNQPPPSRAAGAA